MGPRGKLLGWVVIGVSLFFIMGYLVKYGGPSYARGGAASSPGRVTSTPPAKPAAPPAAAISPAPSSSDASAQSCPAIDAPPPPPVKPKPLTSPQPAAAGKPGPPAPAIKFAKTEYNFGVLYQEQKVTHDYAFTNVGQRAPANHGRGFQCGCTVGQLPRKTSPPVSMA